METTTVTMDHKFETCGGCGAEPGKPHQDDCDWAHCPGCGEQLLLHDCGGSDRPSLWPGMRPDEIAARDLDIWYWHPAPDINTWVPDTTRAGACCAWDPIKQRFITEGITPKNRRRTNLHRIDPL